MGESCVKVASGEPRVSDINPEGVMLLCLLSCFVGVGQRIFILVALLLTTQSDRRTLDPGLK